MGVADGTIAVRTLAEYENEEWAHGYLDAILRRFHVVRPPLRLRKLRANLACQLFFGLRQGQD